MSYQVRWWQEVLDELAAIWLRADSQQRRAITAAADAIDRALRIRPEDHGESRSGARRITFSPPLGIIFEVAPSEKVVYVVQVWRI